MLGLWQGIFICLALAQGAEAAILDNISGEVFVSRGEGFEQIAEPTVVNAGDLVLARPGAGATLIYSPACAVSVEAGAVLRVGTSNSAGCPISVVEDGLTAPGDTGWETVVESELLVSEPAATPEVANTSFPTGIAVGLGAAAALGLGALALSGGGGEESEGEPDAQSAPLSP